MWFSRPSACPALPCMNDESVFAAVCAGGLPTYSGNNLSAVEHEFERELIRERSLAGLKRYHGEYQAGKVGKETRSRSERYSTGSTRWSFDGRASATGRSPPGSVWERGQCDESSRRSVTRQGRAKTLRREYLGSPRGSQPALLRSRHAGTRPAARLAQFWST